MASCAFASRKAILGVALPVLDGHSSSDLFATLPMAVCRKDSVILMNINRSEPFIVFESSQGLPAFGHLLLCNGFFESVDS